MDSKDRYLTFALAKGRLARTTFALGKGRLAEQTLKLFEKSGLPVKK